VLAGGTGQVGTILRRALTAAGHEIVILTRRPDQAAPAREVGWDGATLGPWTGEIDGSDVVINLAGRSVNCRYTPASLQAMMDSRVRSAEVIGQAIAAAARPPRVWLQMSTATIYANRFDAPNDEATGQLGGSEAGVPAYWAYSIKIAANWERAQQRAGTPATRRVALRSAMVMSPDGGGVFGMLLGRTMKIDPQARSSMWEDLRRGRRTEIDYLQGVITEIADRRGLQVPLSRRIVALIKRAEFERKGSPGLTPEQVRSGLIRG